MKRLSPPRRVEFTIRSQFIRIQDISKCKLNAANFTILYSLSLLSYIKKDVTAYIQNCSSAPFTLLSYICNICTKKSLHIPHPSCSLCVQKAEKVRMNTLQVMRRTRKIAYAPSQGAHLTASFARKGCGIE
jgi:ribosomal protein L37E